MGIFLIWLIVITVICYGLLWINLINEIYQILKKKERNL